MTGRRESTRNSVGKRSGPCHADPIEPSRKSVRGISREHAETRVKDVGLNENKLSNRSKKKYLHRGKGREIQMDHGSNLKSLAVI